MTEDIPPSAPDTGSTKLEQDAPVAKPSRRRRTLLVGLAVGVALSLAATAGAIAVVHQQNVAEDARLAAVAAEDGHDAALLAEATDQAQSLFVYVELVLDALEDTDIDVNIDVGELATLASTLGANHADRTSVREATFATVKALNDLIRLVLDHGRATTSTTVLASPPEADALAEAIAALSAAPRGLPTSYSTHAVLISAVLDAAAVASTSHDVAVILAGGAADAPAGSTNGGGVASNGMSGGSNTDGGSTGGGGSSGGSGGGTTAPPPPPPPHPRAALCESLGFGANGASCLANTPTHVTTNSYYLPLTSCSAPMSYGSHTPGFGGTSIVSFTFPWSYRIDYASSGLGTVKFFLCNN